MFAALAAAALLTASPQAAQAPQDPPSGPVALEDITVTGRTLDRMIQNFVGEVAEPNARRGLARWDGSVCVGVANFSQETGEYLADRVSTVAEDLGLRAGSPGCAPNILIVATADGAAMATGMAEHSRVAFRPGGSGMDRGGAAFRDFQQSDRAVRWWQTAMPTSARTGDPAVRLPGDCSNGCREEGGSTVMNFAPINAVTASRLSSEIVNNLIRAVVIVDITKLPPLTAQQLADYIAMVSLAQIDPDADTSSYSSILNVMEEHETVDTLTAWDLAYLRGLYNSERSSRILAADRQEIEGSIRREHARARAGDEN